MKAPPHVPRHPTYTSVVLSYLEEADDILTVKQIEEAFKPKNRWIDGRRLDYPTIYLCLRHLVRYKAVERIDQGREIYYMASRDTDSRLKSFETWAERKDAHVPPEVNSEQP